MPAPNFVALIGGQLQRMLASVSSTADSIVASGPDGKININWLPAGLGADTKAITASEALTAGDFVNIHVSGGIKVRKADAATNGKKAHGFVLENVASGGSATVYLRGVNNQRAGLTPGDDYWLSATTPGGVQTAGPTTLGQVSQELGQALSDTELAFTDGAPAVYLAA